MPMAASLTVASPARALTVTWLLTVSAWAEGVSAGTASAALAATAIAQRTVRRGLIEPDSYRERSMEALPGSALPDMLSTSDPRRCRSTAAVQAGISVLVSRFSARRTDAPVA